MLRVRVSNLITGQRYEFLAADLAEVEARLERKAAVYGRPAEREVVVENIDAEIQAAESERTARAQAVAFLRGLDFDTATAAQTRQACKALWALLRVLHREGN